MIQSVKIYGDRNTGTNVLSKAIELNFQCNLLPGVRRLTNKILNKTLNNLELKELEKRLYQEYLTDDSIAEYLSEDLGWKHSCPPLDEIKSYHNLDNLLFIVITKDPYSWLLSFHNKPYHKLYSKELNFSEFIRHYWLTVRRENTPLTIIKNPIELYNIKLNSYQDLSLITNNFIHIKYIDFLLNYEQLMDNLSSFLEKKSLNWVYPLESTKGDNLTFQDYQKKYDPQRILLSITQADLDYINEHLESKILKFWGYNLILKSIVQK